MQVESGFFLIGIQECKECGARIVGDPYPAQGYAMSCFCGGPTTVIKLAQMPLIDVKPSKELTRGYRVGLDGT